MPEPEDHKRRRPFRRFAALAVLVASALLGSTLLRHPDTPLPPQWNVFEPLVVADPLTPLTQWKLDWATSDPALCVQVLQGAGQASLMPDFEIDDNCGIQGRVRLSSLGNASLAPVETACATALRTAMWMQHGVQPAAQEMFGERVSRLRHIGSYNCRPIFGTQRWSTHSTAAAIDIAGFDLVGGKRIRLVRDWTKDTPEAAFLRRARDTSCDWFGTSLGPDYNAAHADHFHLQNRGWGTCR